MQKYSLRSPILTLLNKKTMPDRLRFKLNSRNRKHTGRKGRKRVCSLGMEESFLNTTPKAATLKGKHAKIQPHTQIFLL